MEALPVPILQHMASFLGLGAGPIGPAGPAAGPASAAASNLGLALSSRRLHAAVRTSTGSSIDQWRFLACFGEHAERPVRWQCWLQDAAAEKRFLHQALQRYVAFQARLLVDGGGGGGGPPPIPRIIHQIWLGSPFPARFEAWRASYSEHHPGWEHRLWTEAEVAAAFPEGLRNQAAFDAAGNFGEKADILRYEVLHRFGGLYADVDMECLRPHDALQRAHRCRFFAGFSHTGTVELNNGVMGSAPGHPILAALIDRIHAEHQARIAKQERQQAAERQRQAQLSSILGFLAQGEAASVQAVVETAATHQAAMDTIERTGPGLFTRVCAEYLDSNGGGAGGGAGADGDGDADSLSVVLLPPQWFYPVPNTSVAAAATATAEQGEEREQGARVLASAVTHAVHHWARSWQT